MRSLHFRMALPSDTPKISQLIRSVSHYFTLAPDGKGAEKFLESISTEAIAQTIQQPNIQYTVCLADAQLAGVLALRNLSHVYHFFVNPEFQGTGIGTALWNSALERSIQQGICPAFTVNASIYAVPVYEHFGFVIQGTRIEQDGIAFIPMERPANLTPAPAL